jgi:phosphoglycerate dehydrogenase-like enzyme
MTGLLLGPHFARRYEDRIAAIERSSGVAFERIILPEQLDARLPAELLARIDLAFFSGDVFPDSSPAFFAAVSGAEKLRWLHLFNTGTDHPVFQRFLERGVILTNSPGSNAVPIAHSAIAGLLLLARRFPGFLEAQRRRVWLATDAVAAPPDLGDQTLVLVGVGSIGVEIARLAQALGLRVIGVRRSPLRAGDPVDELVAPDALPSVLPRADWLALACPLSDETRGLIDAAALARLPRGAHLLNVARGEIVDESALCAALQSGQLAGAYLDVFATEPLPPDSPLWTQPNVIVTPHASTISAGSRARQAEIFLANLERWSRGAALLNRVEPI